MLVGVILGYAGLPNVMLVILMDETKSCCFCLSE